MVAERCSPLWKQPRHLLVQVYAFDASIISSWLLLRKYRLVDAAENSSYHLFSMPRRLWFDSGQINLDSGRPETKRLSFEHTSIAVKALMFSILFSQSKLLEFGSLGRRVFESLAMVKEISFNSKWW